MTTSTTNYRDLADSIISRIERRTSDGDRIDKVVATVQPLYSPNADEWTLAEVTGSLASIDELGLL